MISRRFVEAGPSCPSPRGGLPRGGSPVDSRVEGQDCPSSTHPAVDGRRGHTGPLCVSGSGDQYSAYGLPARSLPDARLWMSTTTVVLPVVVLPEKSSLLTVSSVVTRQLREPVAGSMGISRR